jgi:hypothetical protein
MSVTSMSAACRLHRARTSLPLLAWITSSPSTPSASTTNSLNAESDADNRRAVADQLFDVGGKLPTTKALRSGDLGEIYATEWIDAHSGGYRAPIKRLRWKDHRNMAMRGEDVIAIQLDVKTQRLRFLKTEAKSRAKLTAKVLAEARAGLDKDGGLPSAHALSFISERLLDMKNLPLADAIDDALLKHTIPAHSVTHLLFVFTGNARKSC